MRIGIDARFYGPANGGLGRYTEQLILNLELTDDRNEYVIFLRAENFDLYRPQSPRFRKVLADQRWYSFAEQIRLPYILLRARCDLMHFPHFNVPLLYRRPFVVTIHDLILLRYPTTRASLLPPLLYWIKFALYKLVIGNAVMAARAVYAVSEFTRRDILTHYPRRDPRSVFVTYEAAMERHTRSDAATAALCRHHGIMTPYLLYVGNAYPHKNLDRLVRAFAASRSSRTHRLVLIGKADYFYDRLVRETIAAYPACPVTVVPVVSTALVTAAYRHATAFIFPSLYEGFGLPPLEAMMYGCPVTASDAASIPEIVGDAALLFDAADEQAITAAIDRITEDAALRADLAARGRQTVGQFSWRRMAQETRSLYETVIAVPDR